jgi:hypothetical protein
MIHVQKNMLISVMVLFFVTTLCLPFTKQEAANRIKEIDSVKIPAIKAMYTAVNNAKTSVINFKNKLTELSETLKTQTVSQIQSALIAKKAAQEKIAIINQSVAERRGSGVITGSLAISAADSVLSIVQKLNQFFTDCESYLGSEGTSALQSIAVSLDTHIATANSLISELDSLYASLQTDERSFLSEKTTLSSQAS